MKTVLLAKSSSGGAYEVHFEVIDDFIRVFCHCQAGVLQQMCRHKLALIKGDTSMLSDPSHAALLSEVHSWPHYGDLKARSDAYQRDLREIEAGKKRLALQEKELKAGFAKGLTHGFR